MQTENFSEMSDDELLKKQKSLQSSKIMNAFLIGFTVAVTIYSIYNRGLVFFTFFPLLLTYFFVKNATRDNALAKEIQQELTSRNLPK